MPEEYARLGPGGVAGKVNVEAEAVRVPECALVRGARLHGRVRLADGSPAAHALVICAGRPEGFARPDVADAEGRFELTQLTPQTTYKLRARLGDAFTLSTTSASAGQQQPVLLTLRPNSAVSLTGQVVDERGQPIPRAVVDASSRGDIGGPHFHGVPTDAQGRFRMDGLWPGFEYGLRVDAPGHTSTRAPDVSVKPGETHDFGQIALTAARGMVTGRVVDEGGRPLAGVRVFNSGDAPEVVEAKTDPEGRFRLEGLSAGPAWAFAEKEGYQLGGAFASEPGEEVTVTLRPRPEEIALGEPQPLHLGADPEADKRVALELIDELLAPRELGERALDDRTRRRCHMLLARLDFERALALAAERGEDDSLILREHASQLLQDDPDEALAFLAQMTNYRTSYMRRAAEKLSEADPERAKAVLEEVIEEAREVEDVGARVEALAPAAEALWKLDPDRGEPIVREAAALAATLGVEDRDPYRRGLAAQALCHIDLDGALALIEDISEPHERSRPLLNIAARWASKDPARAEELMGRVRGGYPVGPPTRVCYLMAPADPDRALRLTEWGLKGMESAVRRAHRMAFVALGLRPADPDRALETYEQAMELLDTQPARWYPGDASGGAAGHWAALAQIGQQIGYPLADEVVMRALASRAPRVRPEGVPTQHTVVAAQLALVRPDVVRQEVERIAAAGVSAVAEDMFGGRSQDMLGFAAALVDPGLAAQIVRAVPPDAADAEYGRRDRRFEDLIDFLTSAPERRPAMIASRVGLWVPGRTFE